MIRADMQNSYGRQPERIQSLQDSSQAQQFTTSNPLGQFQDLKITIDPRSVS